MKRVNRCQWCGNFSEKEICIKCESESEALKQPQNNGWVVAGLIILSALSVAAAFCVWQVILVFNGQ